MEEIRRLIVCHYLVSMMTFEMLVDARSLLDNAAVDSGLPTKGVDSSHWNVVDKSCAWDGKDEVGEHHMKFPKNLM